MGIIFRNGRKYSGTRVVDDADHLYAEDTTGTSVSAQTMLNNILGDFATMEDSVAQENHSVGDYIVLGSYFYKVTDAITAGDTFVEGVNGNIERTNVGAEVSGITSKLTSQMFYPTTTGTTYMTITSAHGIKYGNLVFISARAKCVLSLQTAQVTPYIELTQFRPANFGSEFYVPGIVTIHKNTANTHISYSDHVALRTWPNGNYYAVQKVTNYLDPDDIVDFAFCYIKE